MNSCSTQRFLSLDPVIVRLCEKHETPESAAMTTICNYLQSWLAFYQQGGLMAHLCSLKVLWSNLLCRTRRRRWKLLCCKYRSIQMHVKMSLTFAASCSSSSSLNRAAAHSCAGWLGWSSSQDLLIMALGQVNTPIYSCGKWLFFMRALHGTNGFDEC